MDASDQGSACKVLLVYPRFDNPSFWKLTAACELTGRRCISPPLGLITVAAMLAARNGPVRLVDRNAEELDDSDLDWADLVMTGGMLPQQPTRSKSSISAATRGKPVAIGGPDATSVPHVYARPPISRCSAKPRT